MPKDLVCLIFTASLLGLSANPTVVHAQTNQQATEPDQADQPDEENGSDQAASPDNSDPVSYTHLTLPTIYSV